jgi:hypothetical protein
MQPDPEDMGVAHDESVLDWFLALDPGQRLAELQSRVAFFNLARTDGDAGLPADPRDP